MVSRNQHWQTSLKIAVAVILIIFVVLTFSTLQKNYERAEQILRAMPLAAPFLYMLLMIVAIVISPIPSSPLAIMAGALFGPWLGMLYTLISATLGAMLAFSIARFFLYNTLKQRLHAFQWYRVLEKTEERKIAYVVGITRLLPQVSFDLVSYAAGLTSVSMRAFALATFLGMIPIVALLSFFGAFIERYETVMFAVLLALFVLTLMLWMLNGKKNLRKKPA